MSWNEERSERVGRVKYWLNSKRAKPAAVTATQTKQADYIVVGTSHSGVAVLRSIAEDSSYTVIGIEKQARESFMTMGNDIGHFNSQFLRDHGVEDVDPVDMYNDWMHRSLNEANPSLAMQFCQNAGANVDWWL